MRIPAKIQYVLYPSRETNALRLAELHHVPFAQCIVAGWVDPSLFRDPSLKHLIFLYDDGKYSLCKKQLTSVQPAPSL